MRIGETYKQFHNMSSGLLIKLDNRFKLLPQSSDNYVESTCIICITNIYYKVL